MTLPPWRSDKLEDQRALSRFIVAELDRADAARSRRATPADVERLQMMVEITAQAKHLGGALKWPETAPEERDEFGWAVADVPRIRALFMLYWGKRNRTMPPLAEDIAADRWELSAADRARLIDKFQRKTKVSQRSRA